MTDKSHLHQRGWMWTRFHADPDDYRPVYISTEGTPGLGPYWCSGYGEDYSIVCAYTRPELDVRTYWPEASHITQEGPGPIEFSERFPEPEWWATHEENESA